MQNKLVPPTDWPLWDDGPRSLYNLDDFEPTPWPPPGAIEMCRAEGSEVNAATLEIDGGIVINCAWTEDSIQITHKVTSQPNSGAAVWVGYGPMAEDECREEWHEIGAASTEEQSFTFQGRLSIRPTEERWWLMAIIDRSCRRQEGEE